MGQLLRQKSFLPVIRRKGLLLKCPYQIDGTSTGFEIYKADIRTNTWYPLVYGIKGALDIKMLPEILEFMNPVINGKPIYLEYDE